MIGDSLIRPVIPELLFLSDFKAEIKKTQCFVFDEVNNFTPDPQAKIVVVHWGTNDIANCSNINDMLTLAQNSLILLKEKLPSSTIMIYSMVAPREDSADLLVKEFNAHILLFCNKHHILLCDHNNLVQRDGIMKQLESESRELKEELNSYQFEYDELWKKLEDVQEENKLISRDIEWLNRESSMKDKLLYEKVDMINNSLQKVSTTSTPLENSDISVTVNQSNQPIPNVPDSRISSYYSFDWGLTHQTCYP